MVTKTELTTIIIGVIILSVSIPFTMFYAHPSPPTYTINGLEIPQHHLHTLSDAVSQDVFSVCSIEKNKCVTLRKLNHG